jgi:hypothetical protein
MGKKPLKQHAEKLTPAKDTKPKEISVDDAVRLKEIRALVVENNKSIMGTDYIICQIYKESRFKKFAGKDKHSAKGLMQMQPNAVKQVFKYRVQKAKGGKMPSDKETQKAFADGTVFYKSDKMFDEAENIKIGTEYLQYWIDKSSTIEEAYRQYRGTDEAYYSVIKPCAEKLIKDPNNMQILRDGIGK